MYDQWFLAILACVCKIVNPVCEPAPRAGEGARWGRGGGGWTGIFAYMVIEKPIFTYMVFGNMVIFGFMVNFFPVPR